MLKSLKNKKKAEGAALRTMKITYPQLLLMSQDLDLLIDLCVIVMGSSLAMDNPLFKNQLKDLMKKLCKLRNDTEK